MTTTYRVNNEAGLLAGTIIPSANGKTRAYGTKSQALGSFATVTEAIAAVQGQK